MKVAKRRFFCYTENKMYKQGEKYTGKRTDIAHLLIEKKEKKQPPKKEDKKKAETKETTTKAKK